MKYLHTMVRVTDLDDSLDFYRNKLGLVEVARKEVPQGRFTLVFLAAPGDEAAQVELTFNWDPQEYDGGRNFGHLAYAVDDIYALCQKLMDAGITITHAYDRGDKAYIPTSKKAEKTYKDYHKAVVENATSLRQGQTIKLDPNMRVECIVKASAFSWI